MLHPFIPLSKGSVPRNIGKNRISVLGFVLFIVSFAILSRSKLLHGLTHDFVKTMRKLLGRALVFLLYPGRLSQNYIYTNSSYRRTGPASVSQMQTYHGLIR